MPDMSGTLGAYRWLALAACAVVLADCADGSFPMGGGLRAAGPRGSDAGVERTFSGVTLKTFTARMDDVGAAALNSLIHMQFPLTEIHKAHETWQIIADAGSRSIDIQLEALTPNATLMQVAVDRGDPFFKDGATATEIVLQTADALRVHMIRMGRVQAQLPETMARRSR